MHLFYSEKYWMNADEAVKENDIDMVSNTNPPRWKAGTYSNITFDACEFK
jgi:hypothetical protein